MRTWLLMRFYGEMFALSLGLFALLFFWGLCLFDRIKK